MKRSEHTVPAAALPPAWRKSSYSGGSSGECLEVNDTHPTHLPVRDSKNPHGPAILFGGAAWASFIGVVTADAAF